MPSYQYLHGGSCYASSGIASAVNVMLDDSSYTGSYIYDNFENYQEYYPELEEWKKKSVKLWNGTDIVHWMSSIARELNICATDIMAEKFANFDGCQLSGLTQEDFIVRDRANGHYLYKRLQDLLESERKNYYMHSMKPYNYLKAEDYIKEEQPVLTRLEVTPKKKPLSPPPSPPSPVPSPPGVVAPAKKGRGRPRLPRRKKKTEKLGRLWEFLRDLLKNPDYCPSLIVWENHDEGMFRFVHSDKVAKLWGSKKENPDMNYEKLSRAMRYYYKSQVLLPVYGRRLVYKFGPTAKNWRVENPNFVK